MHAIVLATKDWGIGLRDEILPRIPEDLKRFRALTLGNAIILGRKTMDHFPNGEPLEGRRNIVLSGRESFVIPGAEVAPDPDAALATLKEGDRAFCIGGEYLYRAMLPLCETVEVTRVYAPIPVDRYFPDLDADPDWNLTDCSELREYEGIPYRFMTYRRRA